MTQLLDSINRNKAARFASFVYTSKESKETARYDILLNFDVRTLYEKDVETLKNVIPTLNDPLEVQAATEILDSMTQSLTVGIGNNEKYAHKDTYEHTDVTNVKIHKETGKLNVYGLVNNKTVITPGVFREVKSRPLTIAKKRIDKMLRRGKLRQFILENVTVAKMNGETLEIE